MPPTRYLTITKKNAGSGGDVVGPASSTNNNVAVFSGTTGKLLADGGGALPVKATGTEINTGTDDAKFATAKAIADSLVVKGPASSTDSHVALFDGTTGKLLKDGGSLNDVFSSSSVTISGGIDLNSGYIVKSANGTASASASGHLVLNSSTTATNYAGIALDPVGFDGNFDKSFQGRLVSVYYEAASANTVHRYYFCTDNSNPASAARYFGFRSAGTTPTWKAVNKNGTTETASADLASPPAKGAIAQMVWDVVYTPATNCKFYINGVLKATQTTNLPSGTTAGGSAIAAHVDNGGDSSGSELDLTAYACQRAM